MPLSVTAATRNVDRGSHGFGDAPTKLFPMDVDGVSINWRDDPERAVRAVVEMMGEPWASTSYVWFFSATHGLEFDAEKRWTGNTCDGALRVRLMFITDRPLDESEAVTLTLVAKSKVEKLDRTSPLTVQPNYIKRPLWIEHPDRDPLGDIPTIGRVTGARETLAVPNDLTHKARWAQAQGHSTDIADHPNALTAVRAVGSDGRLREHLKAVVWHLLRDNPIPDPVSYVDHSRATAAKVQQMIAQHRDEIDAHLKQQKRYWREVEHYLDGMESWALWCLTHQAILRRKTVKLIKAGRAEPDAREAREAVFERVRSTVEHACFDEPDPFSQFGGSPPVKLLVAPTGGGSRPRHGPRPCATS